HGRYLRYPLPFFAAREDILRTGFLRDLALSAGWGQGFAALLGWIPLRWLFNIVRAHPMLRIREFSFNDALAALCDVDLGDESPKNWLRSSTLARIEKRLGHVPDTLHQLQRARLRRYGLQFWGLRRLRPAAVRRLAPTLRATIHQQLNDFAGLLDTGRSVFFAPEGTLSEDGRMRPLRRGTARIYAATKKPPLVLPMALSYDPFRRGRLRVVVHVGSPLQGLDPSRSSEFNSHLKHAILGLRTVTPSHLLARYLATGPERFTAQDLTHWMRAACSAVDEAGLTLDPVFDTGGLDQLVLARLAWLAHYRLVSRSEDHLHWHNLWSRTATPGRNKAMRNARRLNAAFDDWAEIAPGLERALKV
ncbi:MAG: lysophospholipid acyltransferase family protein, partial [Gammaproteobacteria bacterium]